MKCCLVLAVALLAACGGGTSSVADAAPSGFAYQVMISVDTGDAPQVASFTVDGVAYAPTDTATYAHTFGTFADSQIAGVSVIATTTHGDTYTFTVTPNTCGGGDCSEPTGETCANVSSETELWILHSGAAGSGSSDAAVLIDPDSGTCHFIDGQHVHWTS
jgi:hypothetical protein